MFQKRKPLVSLDWVIQKLDTSADLQLALTKESSQASQVVFSKRSTEFNVVGQVRFFATTVFCVSRNIPLLAVKRGASAGNQRVEVWVMIKLLVSGVQNHQGGRLKPAGTTKLAVKCFPGTAKQQAVEIVAVAENQG